ncbi:hypothetical protein BDZ89DRAFT_1051643 [Hymenopellis radicata]|nr:hypothetical protein BDZ89DRAFT_1051643 [Hymenopellis radicata]
MGGRHPRHGVPIGRISTVAPPSEQYVCQCTDCSLETFLDPSHPLLPVSGRIFFKREWQEHQRDLKARSDALALFSTISDEEEPVLPDASDSTSAPISTTDSPTPDGDASSLASSESQDVDKPRREKAFPQSLSLWREPLAMIQTTNLVFSTTSTDDGEESFMLSPDCPDNEVVTEFENWLQECRLLAQRGKSSSHSRHRLLATSVDSEVSAASEELEVVLQSKYLASLEPHPVDAARYYIFPTEWGPIQFLCLLLASTMNIFAQLSIPRTAFILQMLRLLLFTVFKTFKIPEADAEHIMTGIPADVRTALKRLDTDPVTVAFVCCPKCFALTDIPPDGQLPASAYCTNVPQKGGKACGRRLFKKEDWKPTRRYIYHDFKHWLARLYSRPGMEPKLDRHIEVGKDEELVELNDIWDGSVLQNFKGPDGNRHFLDGDGEGR